MAVHRSANQGRVRRAGPCDGTGGGSGMSQALAWMQNPSTRYGPPRGPRPLASQNAGPPFSSRPGNFAPLDAMRNTWRAAHDAAVCIIIACYTFALWGKDFPAGNRLTTKGECRPSIRAFWIRHAQSDSSAPHPHLTSLSDRVPVFRRRVSCPSDRDTIRRSAPRPTGERVAVAGLGHGPRGSYRWLSREPALSRKLLTRAEKGAAYWYRNP